MKPKGGLIMEVNQMRRALLSGIISLLTIIFPSSALASTVALSGSSQAAFNTVNNSSNYGGMNEGAFFRIKNANSPNPGFTNGTIDIKDDAVLMQAFIINDGGSVAPNTQLTITLPTGYATTQIATADITSSDTASIRDFVKMVDTQPFGLAFDTNASVNIGKRTAANGDYVNSPASNVAINNNVMTVNLGDWTAGPNNEATVTVRVLVLRQQLAAFSCSSLDRSSIDNDRSTFTARTNGSPAGANISSYNFTVKDSSGRQVDSQTVSTTSQSAVYNFNQSNSGTYTVTAVANSDKGNSTCATQQVTVNAPTATLSASTTAASSLPNTGPGDVMGVFGGASLFGGAAHYIVRRFRR